MSTPLPSRHISEQTSAPVHYEEKEGIALVGLCNPPVNGLGDGVRRGLADGLARATANPDVRAVVIHGVGSVFSGGADIRQFNTPAAVAKPMLRDLNRLIQGMTKPVVASIHGVALGAGLELALGCHYRLAEQSAKLCLPEVQLGLVPGGGGTQRLARLIGVREALAMIQAGKPASASRALALGLVDQVFTGDPKHAGLKFAQQLHPSQAEHPVIARRPAPRADNLDFDALRQAVNQKARNALAQRAAISCVEFATQHNFETGLDKERSVFDALVAGPESKALRHLFFAEREAAKFTEARPADEPIRLVGILGAGTMGGGIAMAFANAGFSVVVCDREQSALDKGLAQIQRNYQITASKGALTPEDISQRMARIHSSLSLSHLSDVDLVIEAVFEDMQVKKTVFAELDKICKPGAILATNTSRLNIDEIASVTKRSSDVIGLHFFSPANVMKLLEIVRGKETSPSVIAQCMKLATKIGKVPVLVSVCEGFVGNRMLTGYWREAGFLLEEGATPEQIDRAMTSFGFAMGPLAMADLAGLDINWATRKRLEPTRPTHLRYSKVADRICELGRFGQKTGAGYYRYDPGSRTPISDPVVDALIDKCAKEAGIVRRAIDDEEIVQRCVLALINEGARIVEEGIAQRASDVDVVYVNGYGFPAWRGGPMFYGQTLGWSRVLEDLRKLESEHGAHWQPSQWIVNSAQNSA